MDQRSAARTVAAVRARLKRKAAAPLTLPSHSGRGFPALSEPNEQTKKAGIAAGLFHIR